MAVPANKGPCYEVRRANGTNQIFDKCYYGVVDSKRSEKEAHARVAELNARPYGAKRRGRQ